MAQDPKTKVTLRHYPFSEIVREVDPEPPKEIAYEFSDGRKFESTDNTSSGIYEK